MCDMKRNRLRNTIGFVIVTAALVALCLFIGNANIARAQSPPFFSLAPNWQTDFDNYVANVNPTGSVLEYIAPAGNYDYVPALHFHGRYTDSAADNVVFGVSGLTVYAQNANVFDFHGNPNLNYLWDNSNPINMLEIGGVAVTNSRFTFSNSTFYLEGSSVGMIYSMTSSEVNITNTQFYFSGSNNAALILPQFTGDTGQNVVNVDVTTVFDLGYEGANTAIAVGADNTLLNFAGTLVLRGDADRGLYLRGQGITVDGVGGTGGLTININSLSDGQGIANYSNRYYYGIGGTGGDANTVIGATINVGSSAGSGVGNVGILNGTPDMNYYYEGGANPTPNLIVQDSTLNVGSYSIGMINYDVLEVINSTISSTGARRGAGSEGYVVAANHDVLIKNGFDDSLHIIEQPELVFQIQYWDANVGMWVAYTDNSPPLEGFAIRYRLAIAPEEDGAGYRIWGSGHWTTATLGVGYEIGEDSIKISENAQVHELPEPPEAEESFLHADIFSGESLIDADAVLIVDSTTITAADIAIENHGKVTIQNGSKITAGAIGILSEYVQNVQAVIDPDMFLYVPGYGWYDNNITVDNSVITGAGSTAIKTQDHQFYRVATPDDDGQFTGEETGYYTSFYMLGWAGSYYGTSSNLYDSAGRNINIINGSKLGEDPDVIPGGQRVGIGIDFSGDLHDIYIDPTSEINATNIGIRSTGVAVYGWAETPDEEGIGSYAGTMSRITIEGKVTAGIPGGQAPVVGTDPITHRPLAYNLNDPAIYAKYVDIDPKTGKLIPAIDPATGRPYVDPRSGVQIVTIRDTAAIGTGIVITGDSLMWDIQGGPDDGAWSGYLGPVVSEINVIGEGALLQGGYAAIEIDEIGRDNATHVSKILSGRNGDVSNFDSWLKQGTDPTAYANGLDNMTIVERAELIDVLDTSGIKGDIITWYNGVAGWVAEDGSIRVSNASSLEGGYNYYGVGDSFGWWHVDKDNAWTSYFATIGGESIAEEDFKSKLFGHRDYYPNNVSETMGGWWTTVPQGTPSGRSVVLDEILLQRGYAVEGYAADSLRFADGFHFIDAFEALLNDSDLAISGWTGLSRAEITEGLTRDGTLLKFGDDIFSGNIYGGGFGSTHADPRTGNSPVTDRQGNIDVQFTSFTAGQTQTTIFNNNTSYVRNAHVKADGHLLMNDATFIVDQYTLTGVDATRLIIHDFINEGILSGNGTFQLSQRGETYDGYLVNFGILAPGLPGAIQTPVLELVPGGQFGKFDITGSVLLGTPLETRGTYEVTTSKDSYGEIFSYWANYLNTAPLSADDREERVQILTEQYGTQLQWFSSPFAVDPATGQRIVPAGIDPVTTQLQWLSNPANLTALDRVLMRFGRSDFLDVHNGTAYMGGTLQVDDIYDPNSAKEGKTSYLIIASEEYEGRFDVITSATQNVHFANVEILPPMLPTGQWGAILTLIDDANWYEHRSGGMSYNERSVASALDDAMTSAPGLALSLGFGNNPDAVLRDVMRQMAGSVRANGVMMNVWSPNEILFNQIGYGQGGMSTGSRGDLVYQDQRSGRMTMPYGRPAVPPPGQQFAPPPNAQIRGQSPYYRTGSIWGNYTHSSFLTDDDDNSYKFRYDRDGVIIGSEWNLAPSWVLGGVAMMNTGKLKQVADEVESQDYGFGFYFVGAPYEQFEFKSYLGFGFQSYKSDRYIRNSDVYIMFRDKGNALGINDHYDSDTVGYSFNYALELARPFRTSPNFVLRPSAGIDVQVISQNGYSEQLNAGQGASWANNGLNMADGHQTQGEVYGTYGLSYRNMTYSRVTGRLGASTESYFARGGLQLRGYYSSRLFGDKYPESEQRFTSGAKAFNIRGTELSNDFFTLGIGSHLWLNRERMATLFVDYDANVYMEHGANRHIFNIGFQQSF
ncbi:hypothetical protein FACS1894189_0310 [Planctomycetales bacterium]|nr:hypothetical protein FACS1894189_0310 [Planctomycetales bacterium]